MPVERYPGVRGLRIPIAAANKFLMRQWPEAGILPYRVSENGAVALTDVSFFLRADANHFSRRGAFYQTRHRKGEGSVTEIFRAAICWAASAFRGSVQSRRQVPLRAFSPRGSCAQDEREVSRGLFKGHRKHPAALGSSSFAGVESSQCPVVTVVSSIRLRTSAIM